MERGMPKVLSGIRVLEWGVAHAGPGAGCMLADLGADVVKMEQKGVGDQARRTKKGIYGISYVVGENRNYIFEALNRNKRAIAIDLQRAEGREAVYRIIENTDVFLTSYANRVVMKLGMGYEALRSHNPRLIYTRVSGYGTAGSHRDEPAYDLSGQAMAGIMLLSRRPEDVPFSPIGFGDQMASISAAFGTLAAIIARDRLGVGQEVDASILGGLMWLQLTPVLRCLLTGQDLPVHDRKAAPIPLFNVYKAGDGKWLCLSVGSQAPRFWPVLCEALGLEGLQNDPKYATMEGLQEDSIGIVAMLDRIFATRPRNEWLGILRQKGIICSPVRSLREVVTDPQVTENSYIIEYDHPLLGKTKMQGFPVQLGRTPPAVTSPAPELGEHTEEVLIEVAGYSREAISALKKKGIIEAYARKGPRQEATQSESPGANR